MGRKYTVSDMNLAQAKAMAKQSNAQNIALVKALDEHLELKGKVFMDLAQESEIPLDDMNYIIIENGDFDNNLQDAYTYSETVTVTFWNEGRSNPVEDRLIILTIARSLGFNILSSDNQGIIITNTDRVANMFTLVLRRAVKLAC